VTVTWLDPREPAPIATLQYPELQIFEEDPAAEATYAATSRGLTRAEALDRVSEMMARLRMDRSSWRSRRTWELSTGEKRILEVVSALVAPACLYVLDEPTAGLDSERRAELVGVVAEVSRSAPVLVASQDREWLERLGSKLVDLDRGV
jgi:energy-coupling factor transporter ATP-binding protein EcfA2